MSFLSVLAKWCSRFVGAIGSKPKYLDGSRSKFRPRESDLNIIVTDVRPVAASQKCRSFLTVIEEFLKKGLVVNVVVAASTSESERVRELYQDIFSDLLDCRNFNIIVVEFETGAIKSLCVGILAVLMLIKVRLKSQVWNANVALISASLFLRNSQFSRVYDDLETQCWLGLTGGIELLSFMSRRDQRRSKSKICALQFGQASEDQYHFTGYKVDRLFVYDQYAADIFSERVDQSVPITIAGSPEFEYEARKLSRIEPEPFVGRLNVLFIDQPVHQRSEFGREFIELVESQLLELSARQTVEFVIKAHPRGSAFGAFSEESYRQEEFSELLAKAHVVVSFFSNLADLSMLTGRPTIYLGAGKVFNDRKLSWIREMRGWLVDEPRELPGILQKITDDILGKKGRPQHSPLEQGRSSLASQIIFHEITRPHVT